MKSTIITGLALVLLMTACRGGDAARETYPLLPDEEERRASEISLTRLATSDPQAMFSMIFGLAVDSQGNLYVADHRAASISVLDDEGNLMKRIGGPGEGPGEFRGIVNIQILPGDSLLVYDGQVRRITVFEPHQHDVAYIKTLDDSERPLRPGSLWRVSGNRYLIRESPMYMPDEDPALDDQKRVTMSLLSLDGRIVQDSVLVFRDTEQLRHREDRGMMFVAYPFARSSYAVPDLNDRVFYAWTEHLGVDVHSLDGGETGAFRYDYQPPPVTPADVREAAERWREETRVRMRPLLERAAPAYWPAMRGLLVDDAERIWISRGGHADTPDEWLVFTRDGEYTGSVFSEEDVRLRLVHGGRAFGIETDPEEGPRVVMYGLDLQ